MAVRRTDKREIQTGEERRRQILDAAATVFARQGYHRSRTKDIAFEANVAEGTIYKYFKNKEDLLFSLVGRVVAVSLPQMSMLDSGESLRSEMILFLSAWLDNMDRNRDLLKAVAPEIISHKQLREGYVQQVMLPTVSVLIPLLQQHQRRTDLRSFDLRVALPVWSMGAVMAFVANEYLNLPVGKRLSRQELVEELVDLFLYGVQRPD